MQYLYCLANASLTLRLIEYLRSQPQLRVSFVTVINQVNGWVVNIKMKSPLNQQQHGDVTAFLNELGIPYSPSPHVSMALVSLESGQCPIDVMRLYQIAVVSHGDPQRGDIEAFRQHFINGLGYCPPTLA